jgi:NADPH:quinone reductase-like Zn-dependent oxidoreductase
MIDAGQIKPFIDIAFPLIEAAKLRIYDETRRTRGKLVLSA